MSQVSKYVTNRSITSDQDAIVSRSNGFVTLMGFSVGDADPSGGAAADLRIVDGATGSGGTAVAYAEVGSNESETRWFGDGGIIMESGDISIEMGSGTADVTVYYRVD